MNVLFEFNFNISEFVFGEVSYWYDIIVNVLFFLIIIFI